MGTTTFKNAKQCQFIVGANVVNFTNCYVWATLQKVSTVTAYKRYALYTPRMIYSHSNHKKLMYVVSRTPLRDF